MQCMDNIQKTLFPARFQILSGSMLKVIAMLAMLIDHTAFILAPVLPFLTKGLFTLGNANITLYWIMRKIGRIAFPLFCFLITEGYTHTRSKLKYGINLLIFAIVSEIPYNLMYGTFLTAQHQNVFFTLFLGFALIYIFDTISNAFEKLILMGLVAAISVLLRGDYGLNGALLILLIYLLRSHPASLIVLSYPLLSGGIAALAAFLPIQLYNGKRGFIKSPILKYSFYLFYPVHIAILVAIKLR